MMVSMFLIQDSVHADTVDVDIPGLSFSPADLTVNFGTTVRWTNSHTLPHTSTSDDMIWDSETLNPGQTFLYTFDSSGTFPYHCNFHPSMLGTVTVLPARRVPSLTYYGLGILILMIVLAAVAVARKKNIARMSN